MATNLPIKFAELFQLPNLGISQEAIGFPTLTMESDKFICIRETTGGQVQVVILDVESGQTMRFPIQADAALMNPVERILALRAASQLQIFNIAEKKRLKTYTLSEAVVFWKWISTNTLGIVTATAVYHWSIEGPSDPVKIFDRHPSLASAQIINYRADSAQKWLVLIGMAPQGNNTLVGAMQLYSVDKKVTQPIEGHAACFAKYVPAPNSPTTTLFTFASKTATNSKLYVIEVSDAPTGFQKKAIDITYAPEAASDFPVAMQVSEKYEIVYLITKFGYVYMYHLATGLPILQCRISAETIFVTAPHTSTNGVIGVNRKGQVLSISIDETKLVPYLVSVGQGDLARQLTVKAALPGGEDLFNAEFNRAFAMGDYKKAATVAAESPAGVLRTPATTAKFASLPAIPGQPSPLQIYFGTILERAGKLNKYESVEVAKLFLQQGRTDVLEKYVAENRLECSEELGDLIRAVDAKLALQVYFRAEVKHRVVQLLADTQAYDKIVPYAVRANYQPDYMHLLQVIMLRNPPGAVAFAQQLLNNASGPLVNVNAAVDLLMSKNLVQETTSLLLDVLKYEGGAPLNRPEDAPLQTKLFEINLLTPGPGVQVADMLLSKRLFTQFDKQRIAALCEKAGLAHRALELYTDIGDIRRVFNTANPAVLTAEFLITYFSKLTADDALQCLKDLLRTNLRANLQNVVQVAIQYHEQLSAKALIALFESFQSYEGLYLFLGHVHKVSTDPDVHYKYIEAATKMGQFQEVERMCKESKHYDAEKVKDFLKEARLADMLPLIIVCDKHNFIADLTTYLYKNNLSDFIKAYVQKINSANTPQVVGTLLDLDCPEDYVRNLVMSVRTVPVEELTEQLEKRGRLRLIQGWLEARANEGSKEPALHNALAKIAIDQNKEPEKFLNTNPYYDSLVVGKYCENRDPYLAFVAYKRGMNSDELIDVTNRHNLFKNQARYLVEKQDPVLWAKVLAENTYRRSLIDQVVSVALPESNNKDEVSAAVKAFMTASLPKELIELLEKIVLEPGTKFFGNRDLSNLLILTAIKADTSRVMDYVNRMTEYDAVDIANIAIGAALFEEAFAILKKFKFNVLAIQVLIDHLKSLERASAFATNCNEPEVYSKLAKAQLEAGQVKEAIDSYIKANDPEYFAEVIGAANKSGQFDDLVRFLLMCRKKVREPAIESELVFSLARINKLAELEEFITGPNCAQIQIVGDRCYDAGLFEAAKLLYINVSNHGRLASTLVKLGAFQQAVDAAKKANSLRSWKEVNVACLDAKEFRLANVAALNIIIHGDELDELIRNYESRGHKEELMQLLEQGLLLDRAHVGMFTELAILYSKYRPERLMDHLKAHFSRTNIPRVMRVCEKNQQWRELCFLHVHYDEFDNAALVMMSHSSVAWEHREFKEIMMKVANTDIVYKAIQFYLDEQPMLTRDLLNTLQTKVDHSRVVSLVRKLGHLPLIKEYLVAVQSADITAVNDALHQLYVEEEDFESLRASVDRHANYDGVALAQQLEKHEFLEFRRIAGYLYKKNGRHAQSMDLAKTDKLWKDAMETAADSKDSAVVEALLRYFVAQKMPECFAACLYTCYDHVKPDTAMELAWKSQMMDYAMPYMIQILREYTTKVDVLTKARDEQKEAAAAAPAGFVGAPQGVLPSSPVVGVPPGVAVLPPGILPPGAFVPAPVGYGSPVPQAYNAFGLPQ